MNTFLMKIQKTLEQEVPGLGEQIKRARQADKRSLTQICASVGMTTANWYRIENEDTKVLPLETLRKIEVALNIDFGVSFDA